MRFSMTRDEYVRINIPAGALKVSDKLSDAIAYIYSRSSAPCAAIFYGNQSRPVDRHAFRSDAERETRVRQFFDARQASASATAARTAERKTATATMLFEVGRTYTDRSSYDWDTIYSFKIVSRTAKQLTIEESGETYKRAIYIYDGVEYCKPHGTYSMCVVIRADR
jgi:hypothetical protein